MKAKKTFQKHLYFYWRIAVRPYLRQVISIVLLLFGGSTLDMAAVGLSVPLLDVLTSPERGMHSRLFLLVSGLFNRFGAASKGYAIFGLMIVACTLFILRGAMSLLQQYSTAAIAVSLRNNLRSSLFDRFLRAPYEEVSKRSRGVVLHDVNNADEIYGAILSLATLFSGFFDCLLMVGLMLILSWQVTLGIAIIAGGSIQGWRRFADWRSAAHGRTIHDLHRNQSKVEIDAIDGLRIVKAHGLESEMVQQHEALLVSEVVPTLRIAFFKAAPSLVNECVAAVIILLLGAATFLVPSLGIRFSMLVAFLLAVRKISPAMTRVSSASSDLSKRQWGLEVVEEISKHMPQENTRGEVIQKVEKVELQDVSFAYAFRPEHLVIRQVNITLQRGTITAIVGSTGAGKSTIAGLLIGLYIPSSGSIRVNGKDLRSLDLSLWRSKIGYVSQDIFVFNTTIRENIVLWRDIPALEMEWAARVAQLHDFIVTLPKGYDTVVGDRGLRLSGGQCQRLAIARAILRRPEILIFDEATSALDNLTERAVYDAISTVHRNAIVVVIAHRLSTVRGANQIVVMQNGRVAEIGSHESLMCRQGIYTTLYGEARKTDKLLLPAEVSMGGDAS